ncbi:unnamed protein product (macronuclear) [Paramecium tetraurelia]|uniref:ubiquitinyl hydrolase 1 n=1 Tax=Paramecium tetraurelia TaxID=5888 RepID=A0BPW6_PARTE|nr:uncharacterized protein GSPATT00005333001 [Paramecium tetraurelia]CAK60583.1 unnamed protein product [Paramecium tetraurelia]|eukprot:XP_001427981.1 hypothetical protein (macronuclear) [Paramecium tetraurelia strain d4-2]
MEKIQELVESQKFQEAIEGLTDMLENELPSARLETLEVLNRILSLSTKRQDLQIAILRLAKFENTGRYCDLILNLARLYIDLGQLSAAKQELEKLRSFNNNYVRCILQGFDRMFNQKREEVQKEDQWEQFQLLEKEEKDLDYFSQDGLCSYLIPAAWFQKWRLYVKNEDPIVIEDPIMGLDVTKLRQLLNLNEDSINEETEVIPGPIDSSRLIQIKWNLLPDPTQSKQYLNYVLRNDLREGVDFVHVSAKVFKFFEKIYGAFAVKRLIVKQDEQDRILVDLIPRVVEIIILENQLEESSLSVNGFEQVQELTRKIRVIKGIGNEIKWWKFKDLQSQMDWMSMIQKGTFIKSIKGKDLDLKIKIDDLNLTTQDILICEIKQGKSWQLTAEINSLQQKEQNVSELYAKFGISNIPRCLSDSRRGMTGLQNLGNTCFMNAALQCLSNTYEFTEYMVYNHFAQHLNPNNVLGTKGFLAASYAELMKSMWFSNYSSVSAIDLKKVIGKFAPQFYGYGQQDSHEFLSYLLDGLHEDLNRVLNKPIVTDIEITNESDQQASEKFWINYTLRNQSKIQELMVGQYKSTLVCPICSRISKTFDPFMSLSLPIPSFSSFSSSLYFIYDDSETMPAKISLQLSSDMTGLDILKQLENLLSISHKRMNMLLIKEHQIQERVPYEKGAKWISEHIGILFVQEVEQNIQNMKQNQMNVDFYYVSKATKIYEVDKILSFPRQVVIDRNSTAQQLYGQIYYKFRIHLTLAVKELTAQEFPLKDQFLSLPRPKNLEESIQEFAILIQNQLQPFTLRFKDLSDKSKKEIQFSDDAISNISGSNLSIEVIISEYLTKTVQILKLQRCKEFTTNDTKSQVRKGEYDLDDCLKAFTKEEILGKGDEWYCNRCKKHVQASKKMEIYKAPQILIIHLKRFKTNRISNLGNFYFSNGTQKISSMVQFPHELNLNNFVLSKQAGDNLNYIYDLYGVDNHYGGLGGGHYTAYAFNSVLNKWIDYNDSNARTTSSNVVSESAYLLFYRRRDSEKCQMFK